MIIAVVNFLTALLVGIPVIMNAVKKAKIDQDKESRKKIDEDQQKSIKEGRPTNAFWDDRHL
jgi:hypothetical protein